MQRWEYITLGLLNSYGLQYKLNGEKQNQWKEKHLHEVLHDLGQYGWEMVSFDGESYIFKRPAVAQTGAHVQAAAAGVKTLKPHDEDHSHPI